jgi:hypothetical protein
MSAAYEMDDFPLGTQVIAHTPDRNIAGTVIAYSTTAPGYLRVGYDYLPQQDRYASGVTIHAYFVEAQA